MTISKSQYIRGLQCQKSLWLYKYKPELRDIPDPQTQTNLERGYEVGDLAKKLFPNGVEIEFNSDDFDGMINKTKELIDSGVDVIYEATFKEDGIFAMADILVRVDDGWQMYEVKSSTKVKDYYIDDASIQWYAISKAILLKKAFIVHINNQYIRRGDLNIDELFAIEEITDEVLKKQDDIPKKLKEFENMLKGEEPDIDIGAYCFDPFECDFSSYCWRHIDGVK
jgi:hypothetical protein